MIIDKQSIKGIIVWGIIAGDSKLITEIENKLTPNFGQIILKSPVKSFDFTNYYEEEMGKDLKRCWLVTERAISLERLAEIKLYAIQTEKIFANERSQRRINIDPGFLTLSNFVLATTKDYGHRIYLKDGIFAEVTLIYRNKSYQYLEWTYPDYRNAVDFFNEVRRHYQDLLKRI
jgi:hypothetical protein